MHRPPQDDAEIALLNVEAARLAKRCANAYMEQNPDSFKLVAGAIGEGMKVHICPHRGHSEDIHMSTPRTFICPHRGHSYVHTEDIQS